MPSTYIKVKSSACGAEHYNRNLTGKLIAASHFLCYTLLATSLFIHHNPSNICINATVICSRDRFWEECHYLFPCKDLYHLAANYEKTTTRYQNAIRSVCLFSYPVSCSRKNNKKINSKWVLNISPRLSFPIITVSWSCFQGMEFDRWFCGSNIVQRFQAMTRIPVPFVLPFVR